MFEVGDEVIWQIIPGRADPMRGTVRSAHPKFIMVGTGKMVTDWTLNHRQPHRREMRYAVELNNPTLATTGDVLVAAGDRSTTLVEDSSRA